MITGYNTDIRYREKVFHVQTEDKGVGNPFIESVVYFGGQVLVARRSGYADLVSEGKGAEAISARMDHQHRMMIAAIRAGKLDGKIREVLGPSFAAEEPVSAAVAVAAETGSVGVEDEDEPGSATLLDSTREGFGPTLDQVILDYLTTEAQQEQLELALDSSLPGAGVAAKVRFVATSSRTGLPVSGAQVTVKMISTVRDPLLLAQGTTDEDGQVELGLQVPALSRGAAALIVSASSLIGSAEIKQLLA